MGAFDGGTGRMSIHTCHDSQRPYSQRTGKMTRARDYALALLVGVCCLGHASAFAQSGPPGSAPNTPGGGAAGGGYSVPPLGGQDPAYGDPWYGNADEVEASINRFGPRVYVDKWFLRAEYLNWNIGSPGKVLLGAPVAGIDHPDRLFPVFPPGSSVAFGLAQVPTTNSLNLNDASGVQVTAGLDFVDGGRFEVSSFMLGRKQSAFRLTGQPDLLFDTDFDLGIDTKPIEKAEGEVTSAFIGTSTLSNGQISNHLFLYNQTFTAVYTSQLWGSEANYLFGDAVDTFQLLPLVGARYMNLTESLTQIGVFQDQFIGGAPVSTQIGSHTINNIWGGQIGFRGQVVTKYIEFGATPKLLMLGNTAYSSVYAARFRSNSDPTVFNDNLTTRFTFGTDVNAFATVNIAPNFSVRVGYNILWINQVTRPHRDIVYDDHGPLAPAGIGQQTVFHDIFIHGFSFGGEFRF